MTYRSVIGWGKTCSVANLLSLSLSLSDQDQARSDGTMITYSDMVTIGKDKKYRVVSSHHNTQPNKAPRSLVLMLVLLDFLGFPLMKNASHYIHIAYKAKLNKHANQGRNSLVDLCAMSFAQVPSCFIHRLAKQTNCSLLATFSGRLFCFFSQVLFLFMVSPGIRGCSVYERIIRNHF